MEAIDYCKEFIERLNKELKNKKTNIFEIFAFYKSTDELMDEYDEYDKNKKELYQKFIDKIVKNNNVKFVKWVENEESYYCVFIVQYKDNFDIIFENSEYKVINTDLKDFSSLTLKRQQ